MVAAYCSGPVIVARLLDAQNAAPAVVNFVTDNIDAQNISSEIPVIVARSLNAWTTTPVVATSVTDNIDSQKISSEILDQENKMDFVIHVQMNELRSIAEVDEPVVQKNNDNANTDAATNEAPCLSGQSIDYDTIGPSTPPLTVPTGTNFNVVDGKTATAFEDDDSGINIRPSPLAVVPTVPRADDELEVPVEAGKKSGTNQRSP